MATVATKLRASVSARGPDTDGVIAVGGLQDIAATFARSLGPCATTRFASDAPSVCDCCREVALYMLQQRSAAHNSPSKCTK